MSRLAVIEAACSSCAHRNAALISLGKYEEPRSIQVYWSTRPRANWVLLVPFSQRTSARSAHSGALTVSAPPSPAMTFFDSWKLMAAACPIEPSGRPL